jgi:small-conductance mechanosensitive channel
MAGFHGSYTTLLDFGDDSVHFELRCFVDFGRGGQTKDELQMAIDRAFKEQGIEFAIPKINIQVPEGLKKWSGKAIQIGKK